MKRGYPAVGVGFQQVGIQRMIVGMHQQGGVGLVARVGLADALQVHVDHGVAIEHHKFIGEQIETGQQRARRAQRFALHDGADAQAPSAAVAEMLFDHVGAVAGER